MFSRVSTNPTIGPAPLLDVPPPRYGAIILHLPRLAWALAMRRTTLSIIDQGIVSAGNFATTVMIGRFCRADELGIYSLGFTLVVMLASVQTALVSVPYTIYGNRLHGSAQRIYAGSALMHFVLLAILAAVLLAVSGVAGWLVAGNDGLVPVLWILVPAMPFLLLREFVRRFAFAHLRVGSALWLDVAVTAGQLGALVLLAWTGMLSAVTGYAAIGVASAAAGGAALLLIRRDFIVDWTRVGPDLRQSWLLGRWVVAGHAVTILQSYGVHWMLALMLTAAETGIFAACMTVLLLANPLVNGIGNILEPSAARAYAQGGTRDLNHIIWKTTALLGGTMAVYCLLVMIGGAPLVAWMYKGGQYAHQGPTLSILALAVLIGSLDLGAAHGLRVIERPDMGFHASLASLLVTIAMGLVLVPHGGTRGGAIALLAGNFTGAALRCGAFLYFSARHPSGAPAIGTDPSGMDATPCGAPDPQPD